MDLYSPSNPQPLAVPVCISTAHAHLQATEDAGETRLVQHRFVRLTANDAHCL
jgi:hypothetical protein